MSTISVAGSPASAVAESAVESAVEPAAELPVEILYHIISYAPGRFIGISHAVTSEALRVIDTMLSKVELQQIYNAEWRGAYYYHIPANSVNAVISSQYAKSLVVRTGAYTAIKSEVRKSRKLVNIENRMFCQRLVVTRDYSATVNLCTGNTLFAARIIARAEVVWYMEIYIGMFSIKRQHGCWHDVSGDGSIRARPQCTNKNCTCENIQLRGRSELQYFVQGVIGYWYDLMSYFPGNDSFDYITSILQSYALGGPLVSVCGANPQGTSAAPVALPE